MNSDRLSGFFEIGLTGGNRMTTISTNQDVSRNWLQDFGKVYCGELAVKVYKCIGNFKWLPL